MRTEGEVRERLESTRVELAVIQQQYRDLTDALSVQDQDLDALALEGMMARLRASLRALEWVLATD
jgi:hypothetical protein